MAGIESAVEAAGRYIIKRPRLTRLLDKADAPTLMLIAPAGFGKTTLAREWAGERPHVWYRGTTATADVAALLAGLATTVSEVIPDAGTRAVTRMRVAGTPEQDVDILAELFAEDLAAWPEDTWLVFDDYQFAMEATAPERLVDVLLRRTPIRLLLTSRKRPTWATSRRLLYGEVYELGRNELAMDHDEAAEVLSHRKDAAAAGLVALAEGWPAVIGLAALTDDFELPEGSLPDALYDYFADELYQAASPKVQEGLRRLALAPFLSKKIAELLLPDAAREVIEVGIRLGFLGTRSGNLELHPLLRTFLTGRTAEHSAETRQAATRLALYLIEQGAWDDVLTLVERFFSESLLVQTFEQGLTAMLVEARTATLARWVELAEEKRVDAPIVDLAQAEMAFHRGERFKSRTLALRAARGFGDEHPMTSRAHYIAGTSARLDARNDEARSCYARALATASTTVDRRNAVYGDLVVLLDLNMPNAGERLADLVELDDGTADSDVRIAVARLLIGIRTGNLDGINETMDSAGQLISRLTEPHLVSSFYFCHAFLHAVQGRYRRALALAARCEQYANDARLPFVLPHAQLARAMAELGLRHFARCSRVLDRIDRRALVTGDVFSQVESQLVRARLLISQGLATRAIDLLDEPPKRFPFAGERGEHLATLGLAYACAGNTDTALRLAHDARETAQTVEVQALGACTEAIVILTNRRRQMHSHVRRTAETIFRVGGIDSLVTAYRGHPPLLTSLAMSPDAREHLMAVTDQAQDWALAEACGLESRSRRGSSTAVSRREREVLDLMAQGLTNKEIAGTLFISEATVKAHARHIFEKLRVSTRTEAAVKAAELYDD